jgi:hypothetical protein
METHKTHSQTTWLSQRRTVLHFLEKKSRLKTCEDTKLIEFLLRRTFEKLKKREVSDAGQTDRILCREVDSVH